MGGCATKPKVLKDDDPSDAVAPAPVPAPSTSPRAPPQKEEDTVVKEAVVENDAKDQMEGAVVVDHDSATKNSSLGNLFKENQEGKDSGAETVKVPDVSEVTTKEVEKTIPEDSSLKRAEEKKIEEEDAKEKKTAATEEEVVGEIAEKKPDEVNVVMAEEKNVDHIKPRLANPDEKKPETQQQQQQQEQEEKEKKETDESLKPAIVHPPPPPPPAADQEKFATPKEKPEETYATTAKEEKKPEAEQIQGEEQQTLKK